MPFQFHKGTIRTLLYLWGSQREKGEQNFNSIKVQLEPQTFCLHARCPRFQFHKGTIRTVCSSVGVSPGVGFQFHKGTIRTKFEQS